MFRVRFEHAFDAPSAAESRRSISACVCVCWDLPHARNTHPDLLPRNMVMVVFVLQIHLEKVLGITAPGNRALACDPQTGLLAYPAG